MNIYLYLCSAHSKKSAPLLYNRTEKVEEKKVI